VLRQAKHPGAAKLFAFGLMLGVARDPGGCGGVDSSSTSGVNAPCTRDKDCKDDLACQKGVCTAPSTDGGAGDGSADGSASDSGEAGAKDAAGGG
jgi:hypothetical protein